MREEGKIVEEIKKHIQKGKPLIYALLLILFTMIAGFIISWYLRYKMLW